MRRADLFKALHTAPAGFIMPNAWDAGSAVVLAEAGFPAIATTSAGIAFSLGRPDYDADHADLAVTRAEAMARVRQIVGAVSVPVNGDLEAGYGDGPEAVAETIRMAMAAGLAGGNIEDRKPRTGGLYEEDLAVARIRAARAAIDEGGGGFVLTARTDVLLVAKGDIAAAARRANRFREAGADCLYAPGAADLDAVRTLVREVDGPLNVVTGLGGARLDPRVLLDAGVRRVSLGGAIARAALGFVRAAARELRDAGTIGFAAGQIPQAELNALFARGAES